MAMTRKRVQKKNKKLSPEESLRKVIFEITKSRFGKVPKTFREKIRKEKLESALRHYLRIVGTCVSANVIS